MRLTAVIIAFGLAACSPSVDLSSIPEQPDSPPIFASATEERIKIVGSSTVAPFSTTVAEQFGAASKFATPIVESTGTGGGFKAFCRSIGSDTPSITNASRKIKASEQQLCLEAGIDEIIEVRIGFDGIVLANAKSAPDLDLTKEEIYRALAAELPDGEGGWIDNPNKSWRDISDDLPDMQILVSGPPPTSGTRDAFVEIAMEGGAAQIPELAALKETDSDEFKRRAHRVRNDGAWIDSGENDSGIVQTLLKNDDSIGVMGYSFLEQNLDRIKGAKVGGVTPQFDQIASGDYGISRSMYFYVKAQNLNLAPGLVEYVSEFTQEDAWGPEGYLIEKGLIPLSAEDRVAVRESVLEKLRSEDTALEDEPES
ncbi:MAG: substrate-binding domain-containing protein [Henriciella sp.]|nr:substrate-binding domain-containing protein [Henriciella sp.]